MEATTPEGIPTAAAVHPLTRQDAASYAQRYFAKITQRYPGPRIDSYYTYRQLTRDPAFTEAASSWPSYFLSFPDGDDAIFRMFQPPVSPELELWLLEYVQIQWPEADLFSVMTITADRSLHPLHIAAAIGLPNLCQRIAEEYKDSVNQLSIIGTPLYCALVGPRIFLQQGHRGFKSPDPADCLSLAMAETIHALLDAGAKGLNMTRPRYNTTFSVQRLAFLVCNRLRSPELFRLLYPPEPDLLGIEVDLEFQKWVTDPRLWKFDPYGLKHHSSKRVADNRRAYFELLLITFDAHLSRFGDGDYDDSLLINIWAGILHFWELGNYKTGLLSEQLPLHNTTDNQFQHLVRLAIRIEQDYVLQRLSCDPRFDPNLTLLGPYEIADDSDDDGATLLHSVVRVDCIPLAKFLLSRGADAKKRDATGRTPLLLCESVDMLQLLLENGGDTAEVDSLGRNIYHYAAACNDSALLKHLLRNDPNRVQGMSTRMLSGGLTPAAQAIIYPLVNVGNSPRFDDFLRIDISEALRAAKLLLRHGATIPGSLHSDDAVSLAKAALRWSDGDLVAGMQKCGFRFDQVDAHGKNALHRLRFTASPYLVSLIAKDCASLPMLSAANKLPLVTIFENTFASVSGPGGDSQDGTFTVFTSDPVPRECDGSLDDEAFEELAKAVIFAAPEGEERRRVLYQCFDSFFRFIIVQWLDTIDKNARQAWPIREAVLDALRVLKKLGALHAFKDVSGTVPGAEVIRHYHAMQEQDERCGWWRGIILSLLIETINDPLLVGEPKSLSNEDAYALKDLPELLLFDHYVLVEGEDIEALSNVLRHNIPMPSSVYGEPLMVAACRGRCAYKLFKAMMMRAKPLVEEQDIFQARDCLAWGSLDEDGKKRSNLLESLLEGATVEWEDEEEEELQ